MLASMPHPYTLGHAHTFIAESQAERQGAVFAITLAHSTEELIGVIGYGVPRRADKPRDEIDFGYWLGLEYWGNGYATEAGRAVVAHAFERGGIVAIDTDYLLVNPASGRILEKLGFEDLGQRTCHSCGSGETGRSRHMRLTRDAYRRLMFSKAGVK